MAGVSIIPAEVLPARRVQQMVLNAEEPQPPYISRDDCTDPSLPPVIDLSLSSSSEPSTAKEELQKLRSALCSWGCFQAVGHGIPESFLDKIRGVTKEFFEQPIEEKKKYAKGVEELDGYGADEWSHRLFFDIYPEDRRKLKFWPENPKSFREVLEEYTTKMKMLTELVSKSMAKSLNLEENCFLNQFGQQAALQARFNYFPCCQGPDLVLGLKAHTDGTGYTIILQDDVEGLQVLKDEKWITVPTLSDAFIIQTGDQMEIMTNGMFKSRVHRVVLTNSEKQRISVVLFYSPESNKEIGPAEGLISEERPRMFKKLENYVGVNF